MAGIVRCSVVGDRSNRNIRSADHDRRTVSEAGTEGLRCLYEESQVQADSVCLVAGAAG